MKKLKILFANFPMDGHFQPLTGLAVQLKNAGHEVRWYTGKAYKEKIEKMGIPFYSTVKAMEINKDKLSVLFPQRDSIKSQIGKLKFDIRHAFILRGPEYYKDIKNIDVTWPFDLLISDIAFTGAPFVKDCMKKPVISVGVMPISENSKDLPSSGLGIMPSYTFWGRMKQNFMRFVTDNLIFRDSTRLVRRIFDEYGIEQVKGNVFDAMSRKATMVLQSGVPGFEYPRSDMNKNLRFMGPLLPYSNAGRKRFPYHEKLKKYGKMILATQGTAERNTEKIIVPVLEAFKDSEFLVIATTGGSQTRELRERYPQDNLIIEDYVPFDDVMPYADVFITNGGYGGVMMGISHGLPMVVAGIHEGKNEINARVGYFRLGVNLKTEWPSPGKIKRAVGEIMANGQYKMNVERLSAEFSQYNPLQLIEEYVYEAMGEKPEAMEEVHKEKSYVEMYF